MSNVFKFLSEIGLGDTTYKCYCPSGFMESVGRCVDIDECSIEKPCSHGCQNKYGTYECLCPDGLELSDDLKSCEDINECAKGNLT